MTRRLQGCLLLLVVTACAGTSDTNDDTAAPTNTVPQPVATIDDAHAHGAADGEGLPLLPIMQQLGTDMMVLTQALMTEDHATVAIRAGAIAEHAPISAVEVARIQSVLGDEMHAFEELDHAVHNSSLLLHQAADAHDINAVLTHLSEVQRGCVACHQQFRERLRTTAPVE
ncbi:MAG TPA: hypothetical protein VFN22_10355 [Gemmatimonadales bacterium]|nr:hypothetical protein [Gemmatimonadales bacterium]